MLFRSTVFTHIDKNIENISKHLFGDEVKLQKPIVEESGVTSNMGQQSDVAVQNLKIKPVKEVKTTPPTEQSAIFAELNAAKSQVARDKAFKKFGELETKARDVYDNFEDYIKKLKERAKEKGIELETDC